MPDGGGDAAAVHPMFLTGQDERKHRKYHCFFQLVNTRSNCTYSCEFECVKVTQKLLEQISLSEQISMT